VSTVVDGSCVMKHGSFSLSEPVRSDPFRAEEGAMRALRVVARFVANAIRRVVRELHWALPGVPVGLVRGSRSTTSNNVDGARPRSRGRGPTSERLSRRRWQRLARLACVAELRLHRQRRVHDAAMERDGFSGGSRNSFRRLGSDA
jgi:hypothetical protein